MTDRDKVVLRIAKVLKRDKLLEPTKVDVTIAIVMDKTLNKLWRKVYGIVSCHYQTPRVSNALMYEVCAIVNPEWGEQLREQYSKRYKPRKKTSVKRKRKRKVESQARWTNLLR